MPAHKAQTLATADPAQGFTLRVPCMKEIDEKAIEQHLKDDQFFWLDLCNPSEQEVLHLGERFELHPLAIEDTLHFGQRPKLDDFGSFAFLVFYGASESADDEATVQAVHMFLSGKYLITVHREPIPALERQRSHIEGRVVHSEQFVVYRVLDSLTDTFFPPLETMDDEIDALEDSIIAQPTDAQLQRIFQLKRDLLTMRKVITPQRDLMARGIDALAEVPDFQLDERDYFRDVYDHLIRISDLVDSYRDLLAGAMDAYLSTVANRQNEVMKQLTVIATIFLPLSFLTGFFGMNFAFQVNNIQNTLFAFLALAVGGCVASAAALWVYFKRKRWT